jgi:hypothetical protein
MSKMIMLIFWMCLIFIIIFAKKCFMFRKIVTKLNLHMHSSVYCFKFHICISLSQRVMEGKVIQM